MRKRSSVTLGICLIAASATVNGAEAYPDKPIRLIVAFPAGGAADLVARAIAQRLTEQWR